MPTAAGSLAAHTRHLRQLPLERRAQLLEPFVPWPADPADGRFRRRVFTLARTFWLFLFQVLSPGQSCRETVQHAKAWLDLPGLSARTAAWCQARARLPLSLVELAFSGGVQRLGDRVTPGALWLGRRVRVVDGSSAQMPDTPANQKAYPQPKTQQPGCGFPVMRLAVMFCLASGAVVAYAKGALTVAERELWRQMWDQLQDGDVVLGDRGFCSLGEFYALLLRGVDSVVRLHQRRSVGVRPVKRLGKGDELVEWVKMKQAPKWMTEEEWAMVPELFLVRQVTFRVEIKGWRTQEVTVATTLLDHKAYPAAALAELYHQRWRAELCLRDIKTTLGMEALSCKSPEMAHKELLMHLIAYNLIRALIWEAARRRGLAAWRLSFKGALDALRQWSPAWAFCGRREGRRMLEEFFRALGALVLPLRPGRSEPRAIKTRPKNYPLLNKPRREFVDIPHRSKYRKPELALS